MRAGDTIVCTEISNISQTAGTGFLWIKILMDVTKQGTRKLSFIASSEDDKLLKHLERNTLGNAQLEGFTGGLVMASRKNPWGFFHVRKMVIV